MTFYIQKPQHVTFFEEAVATIKPKFPDINYIIKNCAKCPTPTKEILFTYANVQCLYFLGVEYAKRRF